MPQLRVTQGWRRFLVLKGKKQVQEMREAIYRWGKFGIEKFLGNSIEYIELSIEIGRFIDFRGFYISQKL